MFAAATLLAATLAVGAGPPSPPAGAASAPFTAVTPTRLADTRAGFATTDGLLAGTGATSELSVPVAGRAGAAADATAVAINVTVTEPVADGFVTVHPCGQPRPWTSNLNYGPGQTVPNLVVVPLGQGAVCLFAHSPAHLIVDLLGWFGPSPPVVALNPARLADTRPGTSTVDGIGVGGGPLQVLEVPVAGRAGVPGDATAVIANVTVNGPADAGFVTVFPCGQPFPLASNLNFVAGQTVPNLTVARIGDGGRICLYSAAPTQLVVDVTGYVPAGSALSTLNPSRLLDTRAASPTADGRQAGVGKIRGGVYHTLPVAGRAGVGAATAAVFLNVTVTEPEAGGYVTVYPCGQPVPNASNLNVVAGQTVPNLVLVAIGTGGEVCLFTTGRAHLVVDVAGFLPGNFAPANPGPTMLGGCPVFPAGNPWNTDISAAAVRAESAAWVASVGGGNLHPDFGSNLSYGIPFTIVGPGEAPVPMTFTSYPAESDPGPYPLPIDTPVEAGGDRHAIALQQDTCRLYEVFNGTPTPTGWLASNGAAFDLRSNALRPDGWTSADAAGLPILPGLVRYDEVRSGTITHAVRFTVPATQRGHIHPATHVAGNTPSAPPMGARFRLKASFDLGPYHGDALVILQALKRYGMIVADNGSGWFISGANDRRWDDGDLDQLKSVPGAAFEVVDTGPVHPG
jgi:hypothetical protein